MKTDTRNALLATGAAVGVGALAGAGYYLATRGTTDHMLRRSPGTAVNEELLTRWVSRDGKEVRFADIAGTPEPARWTHRPYRFAIPAGAHDVPVILPARTPLVPGGFNRLTSDRVKFLDAIRRTLNAAGLAWDPRVLMPLWANESGWDRAVYGYNVGNIKSQGSVYAASFPALVASKRVSVTVAESVGVQVFADRVASIDGYHAFASAADYARYTARVLALYPGATAALERGGEDGAVALARALQGGARRYSPAGVDDAVAMFRGSYRASARLIGERYVR